MAALTATAARELPPPSPEFSQAATLKSFRAGTLGGLTLRSEGKCIQPSQTFSVTLDVQEPSVLAFRWSSVSEWPLDFSAVITGADGQAGADLAPQEPRAMFRSGAIDVSVGTCTFTWDNRSPREPRRAPNPAQHRWASPDCAHLPLPARALPSQRPQFSSARCRTA